MKRTLIFPIAAALLTIAALHPPTPAADAATDADKRLLKTVGDRLLAAVVGAPTSDWPPVMDVAGDSVNARAFFLRKNGKLVPMVEVTSQMMKLIVQGDPDRLSLLVGHELGHHLKRHLFAKERTTATDFRKITFGRDEEFEADMVGMELLLAAGYSKEKAIKGIQRMIDLGMEYSSFEGLGVDHPSWSDRLARIDKEQARLWKAMSAFRNGVLFLTTEQYEVAQSCFERVKTDFPGCYEAWVNLGYACLMQYCDGLTDEDLRDYGIGQILTGGFYTRPDSIVVRGRNRPKWQKAVDALREANRLRPNQLTLAKANLGLAYLVHPDGKDVGEAAKLLQEAADAAATDKSLDPLAHAVLLVNLGVANLAGGNAEKGLAQLNEGEVRGRALASRGGRQRDNPTLAAALLYSRAQHLASKPAPAAKGQALEMFEKYLVSTSSLSLWWPLAYDQYAALCKATGKPVKPKDGFKKERPEPLRLTVGLKLPSGVEITLGDDVSDVLKKLSPAKEVKVVANTNLRRLRFEKEQIDLLVTDVVLAICLVGADAPALPLRGQGAGTGTAANLKVGMNAAQVESILGAEYQPSELLDVEQFYRFYRDQGVAVKMSKGQVAEVVIVQLPKH